MPSFRTGKVVRLLEERPGLQRVEVDLGDGPERAYALPQLTGPVAPGDRVVVNTTAVELGLGTGGWHVVHWNLARDEWPERGPGHIIKGRYTSLQADVGSAEEHLESLAEVESIDGMPVVAAALHSQVPAVAVAFKDARPSARLAYVMTDGAGLPLALSDLVADLRARELIDATVTCGHAFGGDYEAVSVFSALAVARHVVERRRRRRRDGPRDRRDEHPPRVQRHRGRPDSRRRVRAGRRAHRVPAGVVRRPARAPLWPLAPHLTALRLATGAASPSPLPVLGGSRRRGAPPRRPRGGRHRPAPRRRRRRGARRARAVRATRPARSSRWGAPGGGRPGALPGRGRRGHRSRRTRSRP